MPTVMIYWSPGRSDAQKKSVIKQITDTLVEEAGARREDVLIIFQNIEPGDSGRAGVVTQPPKLQASMNSNDYQPDGSK
jgi:4-oxalocrotonate tautomerase family enzyme